MAEFQLTHTALVGARIDAFRAYGFSSREALTMCRVAPEPPAERRGTLRDQLCAELPIWIHNIITDPDFPQRERLLMPLRRFEGELRDNKENEVVSAVLRQGFRSRPLDPLNLPRDMPMRQRCAMVVHIGTWQEAYERMAEEVVTILASHTEELGRWCEFARQPNHAAVS